MAGPITWRTVQGASLADASRPLEVAQRTISGAFDSLGGLVKEQQAINQATIDREDDANVQSFLNRLQAVKSPEEMAALQASGELGTMMSALKPKQQAMVRGADDVRTNSLMQQVTARNAFETQAKTAQYAPIKDRALSLSMAGDKAGALALLEQNPGMPGQADIHRAITTDDQSRMRWDRDRKKWSWEDANQKHTESLRSLQRDQAEESLAASRENREVSRENRELLADQREAATAAAKLEAERQFLKDSGNIYSEGVLTANDSQELMEMMVKNGIGDDNGERQAIIKRLLDMGELDAKYIGEDGKPSSKKIPIPKGLAKQAILGSQDQWVNGWNQGFANSAEENLRNSLLGVREMTTPDGRPYKQNSAVFDYDAYMQNRVGAAKTPAPVATKRKP